MRFDVFGKTIRFTQSFLPLWTETNRKPFLSQDDSSVFKDKIVIITESQHPSLCHTYGSEISSSVQLWFSNAHICTPTHTTRTHLPFYRIKESGQFSPNYYLLRMFCWFTEGKCYSTFQLQNPAAKVFRKAMTALRTKCHFTVITFDKDRWYKRSGMIF